mgnify:CR=1 FL=1
MKIQKWLKVGAKSLAILASAFLAFGAMGCSNDGGSNDKKDETVKNDPSGIDVPALDVKETYSLSAGTLTEAYEDASLYIKFDTTPTVNRSVSVARDVTIQTTTVATISGVTPTEENNKSVRIYTSDGTLVDTIYASNETIEVASKSTSYTTVAVMEQLISVNGNVVVIKPHTALDASTTYYVNIDKGILSGKVEGSPFAGISDSTTFKFTTRSAPSISGTTITVGSDKNFSTIQGALTYLQTASSGDYTLNIDAGYYNERLTFSNADVNLTMVGADETDGELGANTVVYWANLNLWSPSTRQRASFLWEGGNLTVKHLTFANTIDRADVGTSGTQAETLYYDATGYLVAYDSSFKSHQDTLLIGNNGGRGWFYKCYIEGDTDFIWGYPDTVLFEECEIRCLYDSAAKTHTSYIFASRTPKANDPNKGLVLFNCNVTVDNGVTAYYGRNSGSDTTATVVFNKFNTIDSKLWYEGATQYDEDIEEVCSIGYKDYGNTYTDGTEIPTSGRVDGAYGLNEYVAKREFGGRNAILNRKWDATNRIYCAAAKQWDLSDYETEFEATEDASKSMIFVEPTYVPYLEGEASQTFTFTNYAGKTVSDVTLSVNSETLASVDSATVTANENQTGEVIVTATHGTMSGVARIEVIPAVIEAEGLVFDKTEAFEIDKDDNITLTATFTPSDTTDQSITWTSSDTNVLRVTGSGALGNGLSATVTGFGVGTATITATSTKTPSVSTSIEITVNEVYYASYLSTDLSYTKAASIAHRDATIVANPVSYGFYGGVSVEEASSEIAVGNGGWPFASSDAVDNSSEPGSAFAWGDFVIRAAGDITLDAVTATAYCSATSNERGIVYVKIGDADFKQVAEVVADSKSMVFSKADIGSIPVSSGSTATIRIAIASTEGKSVSKSIQGVLGNVKIYYTIEGTPVAFPGADGDYNIIDYATAAEKTSQGTAIADGSSADGMVSWHNVTYHSDGYGLQILGTTGATITIKVGGPSVISMVSSTYSGGTITVTNSSGDVIASGSTKVATDKTPFSFLYTESGEDTLTVAFSGSTSYIGKINVKELTTEKAEVTSVKINGAETVSTAAPVKFTAVVEATYMASPEVTWSSGDETTATVAEDGTVTGVKAGEVTITATSKFDTTKSDTVTVTITEEELKPVVGTTYSYNFANTAAEDYVSLTAGEEGTSPDTFVSWNDKWKVHGTTYGIVNTSKVGATISIKVAGDVVVGFTGYNAASGVMNVTDEEGNTVVANMPMKTGSDSTTKEFIYKGEATTLTLTSVSGDCYIATLTVKPWTDEVDGVDSISVQDASVKIGKTTELTYTVAKKYLSSDDSVTWESKDSSIATVENGVVTGVAAGTVEIVATSIQTSTVSGSCTVTVVDDSTLITTNTYDFKGTDRSGVTSFASSEDSEALATISTMGYNSGYGAQTKTTTDYVQIPVNGDAIVYLYQSYTKNAAPTVNMYTVTGGTVSETAVASAEATSGLDLKSDDDLEANKMAFVYTGSATNLRLVFGASNFYFSKIVVKYLATNTYDFKGTDRSGVTSFASSEDSEALATISTMGYNSGYGAQTKTTTDYVQIPVNGDAIVYLYQSYTKNAAPTVNMYTVTGGTVSETAVASAEATSGLDLKSDDDLEANKMIFKYSGESGNLRLVFGASNFYFSKIVVKTVY